MFVGPHGFYVGQQEGNVWAADNGILNGKGGIVVKFSPTGQVLMTLGKPGMPGTPKATSGAQAASWFAPNGDIIVGDGHGNNTNDRIVKFDKTGKQIATFWQARQGSGRSLTSCTV